MMQISSVFVSNCFRCRFEDSGDSIILLWGWAYAMEGGRQASIINNTSTANNKGDIITWVWALPLATAKLGGGVPVSYHHHTPIFTVFLSSTLLVISWSSRIKFLVWSSFEFCFMILQWNGVRELYIIKISFESRALLSCYALEEKKRE